MHSQVDDSVEPAVRVPINSGGSLNSSAELNTSAELNPSAEVRVLTPAPLLTRSVSPASRAVSPQREDAREIFSKTSRPLGLGPTELNVPDVVMFDEQTRTRQKGRLNILSTALNFYPEGAGGQAVSFAPESIAPPPTAFGLDGLFAIKARVFVPRLSTRVGIIFEFDSRERERDEALRAMLASLRVAAGTLKLRSEPKPTTQLETVDSVLMCDSFTRSTQKGRLQISSTELRFSPENSGEAEVSFLLARFEHWKAVDATGQFAIEAELLVPESGLGQQVQIRLMFDSRRHERDKVLSKVFPTHHRGRTYEGALSNPMSSTEAASSSDEFKLPDLDEPLLARTKVGRIQGRQTTRHDDRSPSCSPSCPSRCASSCKPSCASSCKPSCASSCKPSCASSCKPSCASSCKPSYASSCKPPCFIATVIIVAIIFAILGATIIFAKCEPACGLHWQCVRGQCVCENAAYCQCYDALEQQLRRANIAASSVRQSEDLANAVGYLAPLGGNRVHATSVCLLHGMRRSAGNLTVVADHALAIAGDATPTLAVLPDQMSAPRLWARFWVTGNLFVTSMTFANQYLDNRHEIYNRTVGGGAAVEVSANGSFVATTVAFVNLSNTGNGGAVYVGSGGHAQFQYCLFNGCRSTNEIRPNCHGASGPCGGCGGGTLWFQSGATAIIANSMLRNSEAGCAGGAIWVSDLLVDPSGTPWQPLDPFQFTITIVNTTFDHNQGLPKDHGRDIYVYRSEGKGQVPCPAPGYRCDKTAGCGFNIAGADTRVNVVLPST